MAAETVILTRIDSSSELKLVSNDNAFLNDFDGGNNFDQRTLFARFDCFGDVSMFIQKPVFNAVALFGLLGNETFELIGALPAADSPVPVLATRRIGADFSVVTILAAKATATAAAEESLFFRLPVGPNARLVITSR